MQQETQNGGNAQELQLQLKELSSRDMQLWGMAFLVLIVVALGFLAMVLPNVMSQAQLRVDRTFLPQLFSGLIVLVVLLNFYLLDQRRRLNARRERILRQMVLSEGLPLIDPLTQAFSRQYADMILSKESQRADRLGSSLALLTLELAQSKSLRRRFGDVAGDHLLSVMSQLLKATFRGTDTICRYDDDQFLVAMPNTSESQARVAVYRIEDAVRTWNTTTEFRYKIEFNFGLAAYTKGDDVAQVLQASLQRKRESSSSLIVTPAPTASLPPVSRICEAAS
jgi:diguanylate cyclase (GGDEF)-like protein